MVRIRADHRILFLATQSLRGADQRLAKGRPLNSEFWGDGFLRFPKSMLAKGITRSH